MHLKIPLLANAVANQSSTNNLINIKGKLQR